MSAFVAASSMANPARSLAQTRRAGLTNAGMLRGMNEFKLLYPCYAIRWQARATRPTAASAAARPAARRGCGIRQPQRGESRQPRATPWERCPQIIQSPGPDRVEALPSWARDCRQGYCRCPDWKRLENRCNIPGSASSRSSNLELRGTELKEDEQCKNVNPPCRSRM